MDASTTAVSRLNHSNGVRAGSKGALRRFSPGGAALARRRESVDLAAMVEHVLLRRGAAVSAVIVSVHRQARSDQSFDQADVSPDVLTHAVRDLDRPAHGGARDRKSVV